MEKKVVTASSLKVGGYVILDGKACKVTDIQVSKTGKHGHAKCRIAAVSLTDNSKIIKVYPGHDKVEVPIIEKETAQVLSISGDKATVMDMKTYETFDLKIPEEMKGEIKDGEQVSYWIILGERVLRQK
jgi:translation initiation factor 5A